MAHAHYEVSGHVILNLPWASCYAQAYWHSGTRAFQFFQRVVGEQRSCFFFVRILEEVSFLRQFIARFTCALLQCSCKLTSIDLNVAINQHKSPQTLNYHDLLAADTSNIIIILQSASAL